MLKSLLALLIVLSAAAEEFPPLLSAILGFVEEGSQYKTREPKSIKRPLSEYDFIVVGAGSAGCVVANRLSEIGDWKVLLIEAGGEENFVMDIPILAYYLQFTEANWKYKSIPSSSYCLGMKNNQCNIPRGKVMGGSSVLNHMIYNRGHHKDYDQWEALGNPGWGFRDVLPYFLKLEDSQMNRRLDENYHHKGGYLSVSDIHYHTPVAKAFVKAGQELGFPEVDYNGRFQQGFSYHQVTMKNGTRMSASRAYLHPIRNRKNLHVLKSTIVTKVLIDEKTTAAIGVEILSRGKKFHINARKEVILSAGVVNSPQILMLSGIGPARHLEELEIQPLVDLPVGYNLMDHVALGGLTFITKPNTSILMETAIKNPYAIYNLFKHTGGSTIPAGTEALAFIDLKSPSDPDGHPDLELLLAASTLSSEPTLKRIFGLKDDIYDDVYKPIEKMNGFMIVPMVLRPKSKGRVYLKGKNPLAPPNIEMGYFDDERDLQVLIEGVRLAMKLVKTKAFSTVEPKLHQIPLPGCRNFKFDTDDYWRCHARHLSFTIYHQSGTCKMGPRSDPSAVLDERLKVYNVSQLRVIDASMFPEIPAAHPNAVIMMVAEKASDMIKEDWNRAN